MTQYRIDDDRQTLVLTVPTNGLPSCIYWGGSLPAVQDLAALDAAACTDMTGGGLDAVPPLTLCPQVSTLFPGEPGLIAQDATGKALRPSFSQQSVSTQDGLKLTYACTTTGLTLAFAFGIDPQIGIITAQTHLTASEDITVEWLAAPVLPAPQTADEMIDVTGRWCDEFQLQRSAWSTGIRSRDNRTGRTGHEHFPALIVPSRGATNTQGHAFAFHYGWSGGHRMIAEELQDGRRQVQFGHASRSEASGRSFNSAPLYLTWSDSGLNGCAVSFQRHLRDRIVKWPTPAKPRPVHYNCWEAIYFDHDLATLSDIATHAAKIGAERFVLDDGWFGMRDDDTTSLGDWTIDPRKYPRGLTPLIDHVTAQGMTFGIWFEPEMVNADSDLFRAHPDWVLGPLDQPLGRGQYVLDMANPAVRDNLFDQISAVLSDYDIDYVKWDHNRALPVVDAAQTRGTYGLIDRLRAAHPRVEIETCASGGGRIDFGILSRTHRVWLSDCNDALERLRIQHDAALFLPSAVTGSHVGPRHCHTTGRIHDITFRAWVSAQRLMGFEMDPRELDAREMAVLQRVSSWYKANRDWMMAGDILRLDSADPAVTAEIQLAADGSRFAVFAGKNGTSRQIYPRPLCLTGLDAAATYRVTLENADEVSGLSRGDPAILKGPLTLSGAALMHMGLNLPFSIPDSMWVVTGDRL